MKAKFIWSFAKFNGVAWLRDSPWSIIANIVTPICLMVIISLISGGKLVDFAAVGGVVAIISSTTLASTFQSALFRLEFGIHELLVATKVSILDYILGFFVANVVFASPGITFFAILSIILAIATPARIAATVLVAVTLALATTSIALFVGGKIKRTIGMGAISGILSAIMTLIAPTFYPYTALPKAVLYVLAVSPVTMADITLQGAYGLQPAIAIAPVVLVIEVAFYVGVAWKFGRWRAR